MVYRFRVILDADEDVFRDIEMLQESTLEDLHNTIVQSFGFDGSEMASFYISDDEWNQGEEIHQFDMSGHDTSIKLMNETSLDSILSEKQTKLIYVYDFLKMWTFFVELGQIAEIEEGRDYPNLMYVHGQIPESAPEKEFKGEDEGLLNGDYDDDYNDEGYDDFEFDENWN
ncbi:plasmid pRiA4b ORF-3 family protein [Christiangramia sediminis]|uniref:Plasmid pRiA4b ORF-3 family protein n=1 Tax=Christiangramia sediminis TaxID=2881336 RepID=A0A9X1LIM7_9FLAO|nr:plasmid pRiA4b ORF-3 family protein [Christiangramia sediminis]MCB7480854.1 plasmid pRiA4b ORF-3 family protein [Christiangramia sediminis]